MYGTNEGCKRFQDLENPHCFDDDEDDESHNDSTNGGGHGCCGNNNGQSRNGGGDSGMYGDGNGMYGDSDTKGSKYSRAGRYDRRKMNDKSSYFGTFGIRNYEFYLRTQYEDMFIGLTPE
jgi:hypothetical protein